MNWKLAVMQASVAELFNLIDLLISSSPITIPFYAGLSEAAKEECTNFLSKIPAFQYKNHKDQIESRAKNCISSDRIDYVTYVSLACFDMLSIERIVNADQIDSVSLAKQLITDFFAKEKYADRLDYQADIIRVLAPEIEEFRIELLHNDQAILLFDETQQKKISSLQDSVDRSKLILDELKKQYEQFLRQSTQPYTKQDIVSSCTENLRQRWNDTPFLEFNKPFREQKLLSDFYLPPKCIQGRTVTEYLQTLLESSDTPRHRMLAVLGQPGSGKSVLIAYLLQECMKTWKCTRTARVYRLRNFKSLKAKTLNDALCADMLKQMGLTETDLSHSILILDGLDEIDLSAPENYPLFLKALRDGWAMNEQITDFNLIVTCRDNRIKDKSILMCDWVQLAPFEYDDIQSISFKYSGSELKLEPLNNKNKDLYKVLGIPLILYMVLALKIDVESISNMSEIYSQIFTIDGKYSIYRHDIYSDTSHKIHTKIAREIHRFSQLTAVEIWRKIHKNSEFRASEDTFLTASEYTPLLKQILGAKYDSEKDNIMSGQFFVTGPLNKKSDYKINEVHFVHRSIYQYFVALALFNDIQNIINSKQSAQQLYDQIIPGQTCYLTDLADHFSICPISQDPDIEQFLLLLLRDHSEESSQFNSWPQLMQLFFEYGLMHATASKTKLGEKGMEQEKNRFINLLWLCRNQMQICGASTPYHVFPDYLNGRSRTSLYFRLLCDDYNVDFSNLDCRKIRFSYCFFPFACFSNTDLSDAFLDSCICPRTIFKGANLRNTLLNQANLVNSEFSGADLTNADLTNANLFEGIFTGAKCNGANMSEAELSKANLSEVHMEASILQKANLRKAVLSYGIFTDANFKKANLSYTDLTYASFAGAKFGDADLSHSRISHANFPKADLHNTNLSYSNFFDASLEYSSCMNSNLQYASFLLARLKFADFSGANLQHIDLSSASCQGANFSNTNLSESTLQQATLVGALLTEASIIHADLSNANLENATLSYSDLTDSNLCSANFINAGLPKVNLCRANCRNTDFRGARLIEASLVNANLKGAKFNNAHLLNTDFTNACLEGVDFTGADLTGAKLLDVFWIEPKTDLSGENILTSIADTNYMASKQSNCILPDGRLYEDALAEDGPDVLLHFTNPLPGSNDLR